MERFYRATSKKRAVFTDGILRTKADISLPADTTTPVAIIIGKLTASAGENVAVAFKHRDNVIYIGEESYGHLTGNDLGLTARWSICYNNGIYCRRRR